MSEVGSDICLPQFETSDVARLPETELPAKRRLRSEQSSHLGMSDRDFSLDACRGARAAIQGEKGVAKAAFLP